MHDGYPPDWDARRRSVYRRDDYQCQHCSARGGSGVRDGVELHAHHVEPKSAGGSHHPDNLLTLCAACHDREHGRPVTAEPGPPRRASGWNAWRRGVTVAVALLGLSAVVGVGAAASGVFRPPPGLLDAATRLLPPDFLAWVAGWLGSVPAGSEPADLVRAIVVAGPAVGGVPVVAVGLAGLALGLLPVRRRRR